MANSNKKKGSATATAKRSNEIQLTRRVVNSKRHVVGYKAGATYYTLEKLTSMAQRGRSIGIRSGRKTVGVRVVGGHIQTPAGSGVKLSSLPTEVRAPRN